MQNKLPRTYTASEARASFSELLTEAEQGEVFIARHGKPVAAVLNASRYQELLDALVALEDEVLTERARAHMKRLDAGEEETLSFEEVFGEPQ